MKSDAARNGGASNTGTGYLPFTKIRIDEVRVFVFLKPEKESQDGIVIIPKLALNVIIYLIGGISGVLLMRLFCAAEHFSTSLRSDQSDPCL